jgi:ElaB/YqjD/DUF883 family membrane-anchored ribosome-binding protein
LDFDMSAEHMTAEKTLNSKDSAAKQTNGRPGVGARGTDFVRRAKATMTQLPSRLDEQMKANPRTALAVACGIGLAAGIVLSSRIVRSILTSVATVAAVELTRAILRQNMSQGEAVSAN